MEGLEKSLRFQPKLLCTGHGVIVQWAIKVGSLKSLIALNGLTGNLFRIRTFLQKSK